MKFIISHCGVKRELETPFALCISTKDLEALIRELRAAHGSMGDCVYGWVRIDPSHPSDAPPNTQPLKWHEAPPHKQTFTGKSNV